MATMTIPTDDAVPPGRVTDDAAWPVRVSGDAAAAGRVTDDAAAPVRMVDDAAAPVRMTEIPGSTRGAVTPAQVPGETGAKGEFAAGARAMTPVMLGYLPF